ncbi:hypothetical protein RFI_32993 [Reticulomyxa filosa]|uniref:Uncharacterized protein n=1 Tax=Reticulomyxa filosa TaxID=46433 RepID=X6LS13_RETFI|nr:hypothetical protein RFI_32993 [Reticulomyxa filosa]|eukprot:ETO04404.1 hypothetical protein RFI_32993 [Reticulomyxa filosa]
MTCSVYNSNYVKTQKEKRLQDVKNSDINRYVLLKNVDIERINLNVEKVEHFKDLPILKILSTNSHDVRKYCKSNQYKFVLNLHHANHLTTIVIVQTMNVQEKRIENCFYKYKQSKHKCILCHEKYFRNSIENKTQETKKMESIEYVITKIKVKNRKTIIKMKFTNYEKKLAIFVQLITIKISLNKPVILNLINEGVDHVSK